MWKINVVIIATIALIFVGCTQTQPTPCGSTNQRYTYEMALLDCAGSLGYMNLHSPNYQRMLTNCAKKAYMNEIYDIKRRDVVNEIYGK